VTIIYPLFIYKCAEPSKRPIVWIQHYLSQWWEQAWHPRPTLAVYKNIFSPQPLLRHLNERLLYHHCLLNHPVDNLEPPGFLSEFNKLRLALSERLACLPYLLEGLGYLPVLGHFIYNSFWSLVEALIFKIVSGGCLFGRVENIVDLVGIIRVTIDRGKKFFVFLGSFGGGIKRLRGWTPQRVA
jgi:hypothetical protein